MKKLLNLLAASLLLLMAHAQEFDTRAAIGVLAGAVNYQGDLKPNSFTFQHSNPIVGVTIRKPFNRWVALKAGIAAAKIEAADKYNRPDLQIRNLSFASVIKELFAGVEGDLLNIETTRFTPYVYAGGALFHFKPYTFDELGKKVYLKPLSTEGQGLNEYPDRKPYQLTQLALGFGGGLRVAVSECATVAIEFSQRKTFTDYLDDVSSSFVDENILRTARGQQAVDLSFREDELHNNKPYPVAGEQRGTPTEMDWYYFLALHVEFKLGCVESLFSGKGGRMGRGGYYKNCPKVF